MEIAVIVSGTRTAASAPEELPAVQKDLRGEECFTLLLMAHGPIAACYWVPDMRPRMLHLYVQHANQRPCWPLFGTASFSLLLFPTCRMDGQNSMIALLAKDSKVIHINSGKGFL